MESLRRRVGGSCVTRGGNEGRRPTFPQRYRRRARRQADLARRSGWQCCRTIRGCAIAQDEVPARSRKIAAQQHPTKPVKIIVSSSPGGITDLIGRFIAQRLTTALGQQVIVENRPGAGGLIAVEAGVKSAPDGYTLMLSGASYTILPSIYKL